MEITICYFFIYVIEAVIALLYASTMFYPKKSGIFKFVLLATLYAGLFAVSFSENFILNTVFFLVANIVYFYTAYQTKWHSALFHAAILTVAMGFSELVVYSLMTHFAPDFFSNDSYFRNLALLTVFSKILYYMITFVLAHLLQKGQKSVQTMNQASLYLIVIPIISMHIMITLFAICVFAELNRALDWMISISAFLLLLINVLIFAMHSYNQKKSAEFTELQLLQQRDASFSEYYQMLLQQMENHRILIHDIKQHLQSISILNQNREHEKIELYLSQLVLSSDLRNQKHLCDHKLLNMILNRYQQMCEELAIIFTIDVRTNVLDFMEDNDLTALLCNLLDNAMESATKTKNGFIEISICLQTNTPYTLLTMTNSCRQSPFIGDKLISRKKNQAKHGFGMKSIQRIVSKYSGEIKTYFSMETSTFHSIITLRNPD